MATINDDPVTRFTTAQILPTEADIQLGQFFGVPQLTQVQIDEIPVENLVQGMVVFNTDYDCYMGFVQGSIPNTPGRWCNFNASVTYNGSGYEAGSPFALPLGPRSIVETVANNMDPGVMYVDSENNNSPRIYIPSTGWQDVGISGGSPTFTDLTVTNLTVTNNTTLNNLNVTGATTTLTNNLIVSGTIYGSRPQGNFFMAPYSTTAFDIPTTTNPVKIPGPSVAGPLTQFTMPVQNRLQYVGTGKSPINVLITGLFNAGYSVGATFAFGIQLNGGPTAGGLSSIASTNLGFGFSLSSLNILTLNTGDYIELIVGSASNTGTVSSGYGATLSIIEI
jgi:hypothetical protein